MLIVSWTFPISLVMDELSQMKSVVPIFTQMKGNSNLRQSAK
jgi:hypothetical protein